MGGQTQQSISIWLRGFGVYGIGEARTIWVLWSSTHPKNARFLQRLFDACDAGLARGPETIVADVATGASFVARDHAFSNADFSPHVCDHVDALDEAALAQFYLFGQGLLARVGRCVERRAKPVLHVLEAPFELGVVDLHFGHGHDTLMAEMLKLGQPRPVAVKVFSDPDHAAQVSLDGFDEVETLEHSAGKGNSPHLHESAELCVSKVFQVNVKALGEKSVYFMYTRTLCEVRGETLSPRTHLACFQKQ